MNDYHLFLNGEQKGPFTVNQLRGLWQSGQATGETLYWQEGLSEWTPLREILHVLEPASSNKNPDQILWEGSPSKLGVLILALLLVLLYGVGLLLLPFVFIRTTRYRVTRTRIIVERGLFLKSTTESRIADIRNITVRNKSLFGYGDVCFDVLGGSGAEIAFKKVRSADSIRDLVRKAQG